MIDKLLPPLVVLVIGGASAAAFSDRFAAKGAVFWILLAANGLLSLVALWRMWRDGTLLDLFKVRSGDISLGAVVALLLGLGAFFGRQAIAPHGSGAEAWLVRVYLQLGPPPSDRNASLMLSLGVLLVATLEEIVWRGLVQQILEEHLGIRRGWIAAAGLYALAHAPTMWMLAMPPLGKNPLLVMAAFGCGAVWGFMAARKQRLTPSLVSHALFSYGLAVQFRLWGALPGGVDPCQRRS